MIYILSVQYGLQYKCPHLPPNNQFFRNGAADTELLAIERAGTFTGESSVGMSKPPPLNMASVPRP